MIINKQKHRIYEKYEIISRKKLHFDMNIGIIIQKFYYKANFKIIIKRRSSFLNLKYIISNKRDHKKLLS